ncbi:recombinase family protein [Burkholderia pseudomallei]|uniref:recombinase family protein n=1 Tax=Burkholderia pseudomallei TaxID=28450 RepID=UPI000976C384|nr:recombinase family protein [Burkholderia pseudomallei]MBM5620350.1 recombinase family protein [Burkholderia pseudomallei]MBM5634746.1 recombinase family protein [Burkholderia pseudomallei]MBM5663142.1 recombinase family protein [Burkholderia pseudomallei]OMZ35912.1 resolvase [Burkholderia pseudomallei]
MRDSNDNATRDLETGAFLIGYARVSTRDQDLTTQEAHLRAAGCGRIFTEKITGIRRARPQLDRMLDHLRAGDVIVVTRLDRLARSILDLLDIVERLSEAGAGLRSLAEPWADTTTPAGRIVLTVFGGMAEFERSLIVERTSSGRAAAKARGTKFGRKPKLEPAQLKHIYQLVDDGKASRQEIADLFGIDRSTLYRLLLQRTGATSRKGSKK